MKKSYVQKITDAIENETNKIVKERLYYLRDLIDMTSNKKIYLRKMCVTYNTMYDFYCGDPTNQDLFIAYKRLLAIMSTLFTYKY